MTNLNEEIKKRIDIIDFIGSYVKLKKAGRNFKGLCPFHQEKTPSFVVSPDRQIWHCFGTCGDGGDAIKFLMKWENITYLEALKEFAEKLNIPFEGSQLQDTNLRLRERMFGANRTAANFYSYMLFESAYGERAREYLKQRGIRKEIAQKFELGYAPSSWDSLTRFMAHKKYSDNELIDVGLSLRSERGTVYDRFRGRLMFPLKDTRGNIVGFSGRILDAQEKSAKYVNTPETVIYHKRETLFGLHMAKESIRREKSIILVEGEFDMITPYQYGIENIVAIKGSAVTKEQLMLIKRYTNRVYLALDADEAGEEAIRRGIEEAENMEFELGVIAIDFAKDPDEAVRTDLSRFKKIVQAPQAVYDYLLDFYKKRFPDNDAFSKKNIAESIAPFFSYIKNPIVESHYIKKLAVLLDVSEESVRSLLRKKSVARKGTSTYFKKKQTPQINREELVEKFFLSSLLQYENKGSLMAKITLIVSPSDFSFPAYRKLFEELDKNRAAFSAVVDMNTYVAALPEELRPTFDELYLYSSFDDASVKEKSIEKMAYKIREQALKKELQRLLSLETDNPNQKEVEMSKINLQLKELEKKALTV